MKRKPGRPCILFLSACPLLLTTAAALAGWQGRGETPEHFPRRSFRLQDPRLVETSGIACSARRPGWFWMHNDSGDGPRLFAVDGQGRVGGVVRLPGIMAIDWEDCALEPARDESSQPHLWIGEIGNNLGLPLLKVLYRFAEPDPGALEGGTLLLPEEHLQTFRCRFPRGPLDCECLLVHPLSGVPYLVPAVDGAEVGLYRWPGEVHPGAGVRVLKQVAVLEVPLETPVQRRIRAGDFGPRGRWFLLRSLTHILFYRLPRERAGRLPHLTPLHLQRAPTQIQGEGAALEPGGRVLWLCGEGQQSRVVRLRTPRLGAPGGVPRGPQTVPLWSGEAPGSHPPAKPRTCIDGHVRNVQVPTLSVYLPAAKLASGAAVVICPGGGYSCLAIDKEGTEVARWLNGLGVAAFVLEYRHGTYKHPIPLLDAQRALRTVRARCREWDIDPGRIGIMGFSAGGHLASSAGTHFHPARPAAPDPIDRLSDRPDFLILIYPVISLTAPYAHGGSRRNLLGDHPDPKLTRNLSNELQITAQTPPTFLVHADDDRSVPSENSISFYLGLRRVKVPAALHIYARGGHGFGLRPGHSFAATDWPGRCEAWLRERAILGGR